MKPGEIDEATAVIVAMLRRYAIDPSDNPDMVNAANHVEKIARELAALKAGPIDAEIANCISTLRNGPKSSYFDWVAGILEQLARSRAAQTAKLALQFAELEQWRAATGCGNQTQVKAYLDVARQEGFARAVQALEDLEPSITWAARAAQHLRGVAHLQPQPAPADPLAKLREALLSVGGSSHPHALIAVHAIEAAIMALDATNAAEQKGKSDG